MEELLSKPLTELPAFLSAISMVGDDQEETIRQLRYAERKSPPVYTPARDLFLRILKGDFDVDRGLAEARRLSDPTERKCACDVIEYSRAFLEREPPGRVGPLGPMRYPLRNEAKLTISPVWLRHLPSQARLMVLHFWETPLSDWQLSAAAAMLIGAIQLDKPACLSLDLDFVSVAVPTYSAGRRLRVYDWHSLKPLREDDLKRFVDRLCDAWEEYQRRGPRRIKHRRQRDLIELMSKT